MESEITKKNLYIESKNPSVKFVNVSSSWTNVLNLNLILFKLTLLK